MYVNDVGAYQVSSISMRPSVPTMVARFDVFASRVVVRTAWPPDACLSTIEVCASTPVDVASLTARISVGGPKVQEASDTGYTPRSSSAPPARRGANIRCSARKGTSIP